MPDTWELAEKVRQVEGWWVCFCDGEAQHLDRWRKVGGRKVTECPACGTAYRLVHRVERRVG